MTFWGLLSTSIYCLHYWKYKRGRFPSSSGTFHTIPYCSMVFCNVPWHSIMFCDISQHSRQFQGIPGCSTKSHCIPWWVHVGPWMLIFVCMCLSLCGCIWSCVSLSSLGVALCGCVHKLICEPTLCGLAVEPWGCVAGVVIAYLHSKYYKYSLCWVHAQHRTSTHRNCITYLIPHYLTNFACTVRMSSSPAYLHPSPLCPNLDCHHIPLAQWPYAPLWRYDIYSYDSCLGLPPPLHHHNSIPRLPHSPLGGERESSICLVQFAFPHPSLLALGTFPKNKTSFEDIGILPFAGLTVTWWPAPTLSTPCFCPFCTLQFFPHLTLFLPHQTWFLHCFVWFSVISNAFPHSTIHSVVPLLSPILSSDSFPFHSCPSRSPSLWHTSILLLRLSNDCQLFILLSHFTSSLFIIALTLLSLSCSPSLS